MKKLNDSPVKQIADQLTDDRDQLFDIARNAVNDLDQAVRNACKADAVLAQATYDAVVWKLNGNCFNGCRAGFDSVANQIDRYCAAVPGEVPIWGQTGEFLVSVEGITAIVEVSDGYSAGFSHFAFHVLDVNKPFISETGYRSHFFPMAYGNTVLQAAEAILHSFIVAPKGRRMVESRYLASRTEDSSRDWIKVAPIATRQTLNYVEPSGQAAFAF